MTDIEWKNQPAFNSAGQIGNFLLGLGVRFTGWAEGRGRVEMEIKEEHLNPMNVMHGGVGATVLDATMIYGVLARPAGVKTPKAVTLSLTTQFLNPVEPGMIYCESWRTGGGKTIYFMEGELRDADGRLMLTGQGTFRLLEG